MRVPRMEAEATAVRRAQPDFSSPSLSHLKITWESAWWSNYFFSSILFLVFTCSKLLLRDTGCVSSTALCYLLCPKARRERCGSPETAGISEKM